MCGILGGNSFKDIQSLIDNLLLESEIISAVSFDETLMKNLK